jgi:cytochrome c oxidase subunit III
MQPSATAGTPGAPPVPQVAHHFASLEVQQHAARLGMWLFLATEILLFAGLFTCYAAYRFLFPEAFHTASKSLDLTLGTINTIVLIVSSFTAAMAVHYAKEGKNKLVAIMFVTTLVLAGVFLFIKFAYEYPHKFHVGTLPGFRFNPTGDEPEVVALKEFAGRGAPIFFTVYFLSTGLHAFHVVVGMIVLAVIGFKAWTKNAFSAANYTMVELGSMYWHLVDLVWIFLFPMLYLV